MSIVLKKRDMMEDNHEMMFAWKVTSKREVCADMEVKLRGNWDSMMRSGRKKTAATATERATERATATATAAAAKKTQQHEQQQNMKKNNNENKSNARQQERLAR